MAGDVTRDGLGLNDADRALWGTADVIIHSAAAVSFDSPMDSAVEINLLGPTRIANLANEMGVTPHLVAVSTCYVAGNRRGNAPEILVSEGPFDVGIDWRSEVAATKRLRSDTDALSRTPDRLKVFRKEARAEIGAAGAPALASKTEDLRQKWVKAELVKAGRSRAASVGWPDAYAFTKALGEQALTDVKGDVPVSIVRPSIIESALAEPKPGWIRGFRMAEPVIISFAKGLLKEFPGVPEGTVDVIPVDIVVAAIIAVAAAGPDDAPAITQVASGGINPLKYRQMVDNVTGWFTRNPLYDPKGQPIVVPEWRFPGRGRVQKQLTQAKTVLTTADQVLQALPLRGKQAELSAQLEEKRSRGRDRARIRRAVRPLHRVRGDLPGRQPDGDLGRARRAGSHRLQHRPPLGRLGPLHQQHPPAVDHPTRPREDDTGRVEVDRPHGADAQAGPRSEASGRRVRPREHPHLVERRRELLVARDAPSRHARADSVRGPHDRRGTRACSASIARIAPTSCATSTGATRHAPMEQIETDAREMLTQLIMTKSFPEGLRRVREHRALGHRTILITGALDFAVAGLKPLFDEIVAAEMMVRPDGTLSGEMHSVPPTGEARAQILADYCDAEGLDISNSVAYADSSSDLPLFEAVGFPVAVNPETRLATIARKRGWLVEHWSKSAGAPKPLLPIGELMVERERRRKFA